MIFGCIRAGIFWCAFLSGVALCTPVFASITVTPGVPAGFESLAAPRLTSITLYYGGELLGNFPAHYSASGLTFDQPETLLAALPPINRKTTIELALTRPLPLNEDLVCTAKRRENCGNLKPDTIGIIFDEDHLTAELFINSSFLPLVDDSAPRYLPLPERDFSSVYKFSGSVNGSDQEKSSFSLGEDAVYALGEANLATQTTLSNQGLRFDTASLNVERQGWSASGGLMRSFPMQLVADHDMAGVLVATSMRTRMDEHKTEGNDIIVYLPRRAYVAIYRDGRLYSSRVYEAGNQKIDTSELPNGAYNITLKIQETDGAVHEETRFFAKSEEIPPPDAPTYYAEAGVARSLAEQDSTTPQLTPALIVRGGTVRRISDNLGASVGLLGLSDRAVVESGVFAVTSTAQLRATILASTSGDYGIQANMLYVKGQWNTSVDARKVWAGKALPLDYNGIIAGIQQVTASLNYLPVPSVTLSLRTSYSHSPQSSATNSYGPSLQWRMWEEGPSQLSLNADAGQVNGRQQGTLLLNFSYQLGGGWGTSSEAGGGWGGTRGQLGSARISRDETGPDGSLITGLGVHEDKTTRSVSADGDWRSNIARVQGSVQQSSGGLNSGTAYGGNFAIGAMQSNGMVDVGGSDADMSAIVIDAQGDADTELSILINGTPHGTVRAGHRQVIYLTPYAIYRVHLTPIKEGLFNVEGEERNIALYPGNVVHSIWHVDRFNVVAGHVITPDNMPLADARLEENRDGIETDEKGFFQAELAHPHTLTFTGVGVHCQAQIPANAESVNGVMLLKDPLVCRPAN